LRTSTQTINFRVGKIGTADRTPSSVVAWSRDTKLATVYAPAQILNGGTERGFITAEKGSHEISVPRACLCTPIHIRQRGLISALSCVFHHSPKGIRPCAWVRKRELSAWTQSLPAGREADLRRSVRPFYCTAAKRTQRP